MEKYVGILGLITMMLFAWFMSSHKSKFPWRTVAGGLLLQFVFALLILKTDQGQYVFQQVDIIFRSLLDCVGVASKFVFGDSFEQHFIAFKVLPTIIFFSAFMSIFYYFGVIQIIVGGLSWVMQKTLGTSGAETLSSAANIFVGQTEAPLVIRPYIPGMTTSELNAVMVGGFATMAGGVLGALADMGINAGHLLAASVISAPGALLLAKIMQPEVDTPETMGSVKLVVEEKSSNVIEAVANGTIGGLHLALNVGAMLISFIALIAVLNLFLAWFSGLVYGRLGIEEAPVWSLELALGYLFYPIAFLIGIERADCFKAAELMGLKMATNEFVAYLRMSEWTGGETMEISERTKSLMTYALCGFANFASIGIQLGGIGGIAPERRGDLARLGFRAMLGGTMAALMTASIASLLI